MNFDNMNLDYLEGLPKFLDGNFSCRRNNLISLQGGPDIVTGEYSCNFNKIRSLKDGPHQVGMFVCNQNLLNTLEYAPEITQKIGKFDCSFNSLTSLKGSPETVYEFLCNNNKLSTLKDCPQIVGRINCSNNNLESLDDGPNQINERLVCYNNKIPFIKIIEYLLKIKFVGVVKTDYDDVFDFSLFCQLSNHEKIKVMFESKIENISD